MSGGDWLGAERAALATDRILDAAAETFSRNGVQASTMAEVASAAGCSRATLYNHFRDRRELEIAFVHREAIRLAAQIGAATSHISDPRHRVLEAFTVTLQLVRGDERLLTWFSAPDVGIANAIGSDSEVLEAMAVAFAGSLADHQDPGELRLRGRWLLRTIMSFLTMPGADAAEEAELVERFVVPTLVPQDGQGVS